MKLAPELGPADYAAVLAAITASPDPADSLRRFVEQEQEQAVHAHLRGEAVTERLARP